MSYYPLLRAPHCHGKTTLYNFSPNNWEGVKKVSQYLHLSTVVNNKWQHTLIDELSYGQHKVISGNEPNFALLNDSIALLSLSETMLPEATDVLPKLQTSQTFMPNWRASLGLYSQSSQTSYQGEINPFPGKASLLTFSPFVQFGENVENYVLLCNVEAQPDHREVVVEIYDAATNELKSEQNALSNQINIISLDNIGLNENSLPIVICRKMAAIPLYFSSHNQGEFLSMEHTHAPASLVVHGNRFGAQAHLKKYWLSRCKK